MRRLLNDFRPATLRGDFYGGLSAAIVALPLGLAFGVASGAGPMAGVYSAVLVGFFASVFGGTPGQISGPTGPMTVVMTAILTEYISRDPVDGMAGAFAIVVLAGLFQIAFGLLRLGKYVVQVSYPVISGFMSGIGVIIIMLQLKPLVGEPGSASTVADKMDLPRL
ncbi:MAG: SulP family inorganic anion transporter, partial [Pseudomonadales bacterium]